MKLIHRPAFFVEVIGVLLLASFFQSAVAEDQIMLKNGDRITGEIQQIWDGELIIDTGYTDEFGIALSAISQVITERSFRFELDDEEKITARLEPADDGKAMLIADGERQVIALTDIEELEEISDGLSWMLRTDLSLDGSEGNSDDLKFSWQGFGEIESGDHRHQLNLRMDKAERNGITSQDQQRASYLYSWFMADRWFLQAGLGAERDPVRDLTRRLSAGGGLGYQFFDDANRLFEVSLAAVGFDEEIGIQSNESVAAQWITRYRRSILTGDLDFFHNHQISHYLSGRNTTLIKTSTGIRWDVWADIYFNTQFDWDYETDPAQGADNEDIRYMIGLGVELD